MKPEAKVKAAIKEWLKQTYSHRVRIFMPVQSGYGEAAVDFILCVNGVYVAVETKAPEKKPIPTPRQEEFLKEIQAAGGFACCVSSLEELQFLFEKAGLLREV